MMRVPRFLDLANLTTTQFLALLLTISVATNIVLIVKVRYPDALQTLRVAMVKAPQPVATDHVRGNPHAKVTLIEYSDFQCPFCSRMHASLKSAVAANDVRWIYRHSPLESIHPVARAAAEAAECAAEQHRFWEYADALFDNQKQLNEDGEKALPEIAAAVGLDVPAFETCVSSGAKKATVAASIADSNDRLINATPTFWVNNQRSEGALSEDDLHTLLASAR